MSLLELHFLRPAWLLALLPLAALLWLLFRQRLGQGHWARICDPGLLPFILQDNGERSRFRSLLLIGSAGVIAILALAGPSWERMPQPLYQDNRALVIALDLSRAMDATDLEPSRLARTRYKIADILAERQEGVTGLVVYSGKAFTVTPLSSDTATINSQLVVLTTDLMPVPGRHAEHALSQARDLFRQAGYGHGDILLVTAGADTDRLQPLAVELRGEGFRLSILGVGTEAGAPIPAEPGGYLRDRDGVIVVPRLDAAALSRLAAAGGGIYQTLQPDSRDIDRLTAFFADFGGGELVQTGFDAELWHDRGPWLVLLLLPLALLAFRRGVVMALALVVGLPFSHEAAADWQRWWLNDDQRGRQALEAGDPERAAELFRDPEWRAIANYRAEDYSTVLDVLDDMYGARSWYNRGNALARLGRYQQAIEAYDSALERQPDLEDARYNRDLLHRLLEEFSSEGGQGGVQHRQDPDAQEDMDSGVAEQGHDDSPTDGSGLGAGQPVDVPGDRLVAEPGDPDVDPQQRLEPADRTDEMMRDAEAGSELDSEGARALQRMLERQRALAPVPDDIDGEPATADAAATPGDDTEDGDYDDDDGLDWADEQLLRQVEDDPGGLLRRKFLYQYRRMHSLQPFRME